MGWKHTFVVPLLVTALEVLVGAVQAQDWQPTPLPVDSYPAEAQTPRAILEQPVTLTISGNVVDVVRKLAGAVGRDWVVSAPSEDFGPAKSFSTDGLPLWQALDKLLEVYGYDWGVHAKVIVAWPATKPARVRPETPVPEEEAWADKTPREALLVEKPTAATDLLEALSRPWDREAKAEYAYMAPELRLWHVMGSIANLDRLNGGSIPLAIGAITEYAGGAMALEYGTLRRIDDAFALRAAAPPEPNEETGEASIARRSRFRSAVLASLNAQQYVYLRSSGEVQIAFRELPGEAAALFLEAADRLPKFRSGEWAMDWTQPQRLYVSIRAGQASYEQPDRTMLTLPILQIGCNVPLTGGRMARF